jgi:acetyl esterase/lipase
VSEDKPSSLTPQDLQEAQEQTTTANNSGWGMTTRADRDAAYNNSAAVSNSEEITARWATASARIRSQRSRHIDLPYGRGERNKWDLFPASDPNAPCLVYVHGGYWQARSRELYSCFAGGLMARGWSPPCPATRWRLTRA